MCTMMGEFAKVVKKKLEEKMDANGGVSIDDVLSMIPAGNFDIKK